MVHPIHMNTLESKGEERGKKKWLKLLLLVEVKRLNEQKQIDTANCKKMKHKH